MELMKNILNAIREAKFSLLDVDLAIIFKTKPSTLDDPVIRECLQSLRDAFNTLNIAAFKLEDEIRLQETLTGKNEQAVEAI